MMAGGDPFGGKKENKIRHGPGDYIRLRDERGLGCPTVNLVRVHLHQSSDGVCGQSIRRHGVSLLLHLQAKKRGGT